MMNDGHKESDTFDLDGFCPLIALLLLAGILEWKKEGENNDE